MKTATALFHDTWAGPVPATVVPFRTKRRGETVTRYRWSSRVSNTGGFGAPFKSIEAAAAAAQRHACFSDIATA